MPLQFPEGKFLSIVKVGEKGQIVIPRGARELFNIQPGDSLLLMADKARGIALVAADALHDPQGLFQLPQEQKEDGDGNSQG